MDMDSRDKSAPLTNFGAQRIDLPTLAIIWPDLHHLEMSHLYIISSGHKLGRALRLGIGLHWRHYLITDALVCIN